MVKYQSDGVFDATVERVWEMLQAHTDENMSNIHPGIISAKTVEEFDNGFVREMTSEGPDGNPFAQRIKFTINPPGSMSMEWLTGPLAGSTCTHTYTQTPDKKTQVEVIGDFTMEGADDVTTTAVVDEFFTNAFDEDVTFLAKMD